MYKLKRKRKARKKSIRGEQWMKKGMNKGNEKKKEWKIYKTYIMKEMRIVLNFVILKKW